MPNAKRMMTLVLLPLVFFILLTLAFVVSIFTYDLLIGLLGAFFIGMYGITLSGVFAYTRRCNLRFALLVENKGTMKFSVLAQNMDCDEKTAKTRAAWCISHGYLPNHMVSGDYLVRVSGEDKTDRAKEESRIEHNIECPYCGADFTYVGRSGECPYCGKVYPPTEKK